MEMIKRDYLFVGCDAGHDWQSIGGRNAGCDEDCVCSVPVNLCRLCGDSDYGDNADADEVRSQCLIAIERREPKPDVCDGIAGEG